MKRAVILILFLGIFLVSLNSVSAVQCSSGNITTSCECSGVTYNSGSGFCCDTGNSDGGVYFSGRDYKMCPTGNYYYVKNDSSICSDTGLGNYTQPYCTITRGSAALTHLRSDALIVRSGRYNEPVGGPSYAGCADYGPLHIIISGKSAEDPLVIRGHPDEPKPIMTGYANSNPDCGGVYGPFNILGFSSDGNNIVFEGFEITEAFTGVWTSIGHNVTIRNNYIHNNWGKRGGNNFGAVMAIFNGKDQLTDFLVEDNVLDYNGDGSGGTPNSNGIHIYDCTRCTFRNNNISRSVHGIVIKGGADLSHATYDIEIYGNIIHDVDIAGMNIAGKDIIYNIDVHHNIIYIDNAADGIQEYPYNERVYNRSYYNNVIACQGGCRGLLLQYQNENHRVYNNIFYNTVDGSCISTMQDFNKGGSDNYIDFRENNNLFYTPGDTATSSITCWSGLLMNLPQWKSYWQARGSSNGNESIVGQDPQFVNSASRDYTLLATSPGIDKGKWIQSFHCDTSGGTTPAGCKVWYGLAPDIGAYEYNPGLPTITCNVVDVNDDLKINILDLALVSYWQGKNSGQADWNNYRHLDINSDNTTSFGDVNEVVLRLGQNC